MKVLSRGRMVAVPHAAGLTSPNVPDYAGRGTVRLLADLDGRRRAQRYAEIARTNPWVMAAINARAGLASRVPIHTYRTADVPGGRQRVRPGDGGPGEHIARLILHPEPGRRVSGRRMRRRVFGDALTHGNGLIEVLRSGAQQVGLRWQPWTDVDPVYTDDRLAVDTWKVPVDRRTTGIGHALRVSEMRAVDGVNAVHLAIGDDTEGPLGVSPLAALHATHALHEAAMRFARAYLEEGMFPSGVVELPHQATIAQAKLTRELLADLHVGIERGGKPGVIGFGTWKQLMASPEGAKLVELAKASREEVAGAYRVPMTILGDNQSSNKATAHTARLQFVRDVVGEDVAVEETELNTQLLAPSSRMSAAGVFVEAVLGELLRPDPEALSVMIRREVGGPILTPNEGRQLVNRPPLDDPRANELVFNPGTPEGEPEDPEDPEGDPDDPDDVD